MQHTDIIQISFPVLPYTVPIFHLYFSFFRRLPFYSNSPEVLSQFQTLQIQQGNQHAAYTGNLLNILRTPGSYKIWQRIQALRRHIAIPLYAVAWQCQKSIFQIDNNKIFESPQPVKQIQKQNIKEALASEVYHHGTQGVPCSLKSTHHGHLYRHKRHHPRICPQKRNSHFNNMHITCKCLYKSRCQPQKRHQQYQTQTYFLSPL